jgi:hypothetical protein
MLETPDKLGTNTLLIDFRQLDSFIGLGTTDFLDILGDIIHDVPIHLEKIHCAILGGEEMDLKSRAHCLRGMLANVGCFGMMAVLHDLEYLETPSPGNADAVQLRLGDLWQKSLLAITDWAQSNAGLPSD